jgi:hypothetical protein
MLDNWQTYNHLGSVDHFYRCEKLPYECQESEKEQKM